MSLHTRAARLLLALSAAAGLAACGAATTAPQGAPPPSTSDQMPSMSMTGTATPTGPAVAASSVSIKNFAFSPAAVTVKVGTKVTWTNTDQDAHTVSAKNGAFSSPAMPTGGTYAFTFTKAGTYAYYCMIHPFMTATVVVTP
jgi:plastocyanin